MTNIAGSWLVECQGFTQPFANAFSDTYWVFHYTGEDGFEGLSAMTVMLPTGVGTWDVEGVIFPGDMPPMPKMVTPPAE